MPNQTELSRLRAENARLQQECEILKKMTAHFAIDGFDLAQDISERKAAENKLNEQEKFFRMVGDNVEDFIAVLDTEGKRLYNSASYARLFGDPESMLYTDSFAEIHPDDREYVKQVFDETLRSGISHCINFRFVLANGSIRNMESRGGIIKNNGGEPARVVVVSRDITDRNQAEISLAKTRFLAAASHDLRQPLAAANLFIDALKFTEPTPQQNQIIQRLDQSMITFSGLLDSLLNISKLDSGTLKPELTPINVTGIFNWLEQSFAQLAVNKQLGFKLYFPMNETLFVLSDASFLQSVLMNLVSNAIKFTSSGAILVSARKRGSDVLFQVWDTGMGISDENIRLIFDEFYQINNPQRNRANGMGLGLTIAKRTITLLGGEITCRSQIGRGSVFEFRLPLDVTLTGVMQSTVTEDLQKQVVDLSFIQNKRFVVVEDDLLVAQALTQSLEMLGGEVKCFRSAEEAWRHAHTGRVDYYIADYMLSGTIDGIQFLNMLSQRLGKPINAVLMTGETSSDLIKKAAECDWPVLFKPVNTFKLISNLKAQQDKHA
ncbi:MAG: ATP-binding protein [Gallionella sp.]|nr:ATP-binding protein [Gallionella sp.]